MKREFDFNISASVTFDLDANSSRSLHQVSQDIMEEVSSELQVFQRLSEPLAYGGLVLLAFSFLRSGLTLHPCASVSFIYSFSLTTLNVLRLQCLNYHFSKKTSKRAHYHDASEMCVSKLSV